MFGTNHHRNSQHGSYTHGRLHSSGSPQGADPQVWHWFSAVDTDRSGYITANELQTALINANGAKFDLDTVKMLMNIFDTDRSGTIGFQEFTGLWKYIVDWQNVFRHFDHDQSGSIDGRELTEALQSFGYNLSPALLTLIEHKYASGPIAGYGPPPGITFDRFVRACVTIKTLTDSFKRLDVDRDGWVQLNYEQFMSRPGNECYDIWDMIYRCRCSAVGRYFSSSLIAGFGGVRKPQPDSSNTTLSPPSIMSLNREKVVAWPPVLPYDRQGVPVPGTKRPGQTAHYRNAIYGLLTEHTPNSLKTLDEVFSCGLKVGQNQPFLGHRPIVSQSPLRYANKYVWQTYGEVDERRRHIGSALHAMFRAGTLGGGEYDTVGIWSQNRPEWQIIDIALQSYQKVSVSLYDTLGKDSVEYIVNHAHLTVVFSTSDHLPTLLRLANKAPQVRLLVSIDDLTPEAKKVLVEWGQSHDIKVMELRELEAFGKANRIEPIPASPDLVVSICYTSGTTNNPKGVVLRHRNLALAVQSNLYGLQLPDNGTLLSYLPLAHIYERICELCCIAVGARIGYFSGDPLRLLEDAQILRPQFFPSVPRVLNRVYQAAMVGGNVPGLRGNIFRKAISVKLEKLHRTGDPTHALWDKLVFRKIQAVLGGQLMLVTSGSAPINGDVMDFLKIAFACEVDEGHYGMTENCATCTKTLPNDPSGSGTVGPPQPVNEVKLIDVPSMDYTSEDKPNPRGELCVRGDNCFSEYYKDEANTRQTVDGEGWIRTGDVAEIDACGRVKIIDRVKNIMKLAQGEYVALEKIENMYSGSPIVSQIYVHGDSLQSFLVAVVVPDPTQLANLASTLLGRKVSPEDQENLLQALANQRIHDHILSMLTNEAKRSGLKGFETVKRIHLTLEAFSIENGTLTPTLKIKRKDAHKMYKTMLDELYELGEPGSR
ncbi:hypothetical protein AX17_003481 [Amanita inopinata Kibby_2008]|nr:hypothetical protein AX17_003481 [Amanita inopinata Kibby_2008]